MSSMQVRKAVSSDSNIYKVYYSFSKSTNISIDIMVQYSKGCKILMIYEQNEKLREILDKIVIDKSIDLENGLVTSTYYIYKIVFQNIDDFAHACDQLLSLILSYGEKVLNITID